MSNDLDCVPQKLLIKMAMGNLSGEDTEEMLVALNPDAQPGDPSYRVVMDIGDSLTLLHHMAAAGNTESVSTLLSAGHPTEVRTVHGETPLDQAAWQGHHDMCVLLVAVGKADPNCTTQGGYTPLHRAAFYGHNRLAASLLLLGADPTIVDGNGDTPYDCAVAQGNQTIADTLAPVLNQQGENILGVMYARNNPRHPDHRPEALEAILALSAMEAKLAQACLFPKLTDGSVSSQSVSSFLGPQSVSFGGVHWGVL